MVLILKSSCTCIMLFKQFRHHYHTHTHPPTHWWPLSPTVYFTLFSSSSPLPFPFLTFYPSFSLPFSPLLSLGLCFLLLSGQLLWLALLLFYKHNNPPPRALPSTPFQSIHSPSFSVLTVSHSLRLCRRFVWVSESVCLLQLWQSVCVCVCVFVCARVCVCALVSIVLTHARTQVRTHTYPPEKPHHALQAPSPVHPPHTNTRTSRHSPLSHTHTNTRHLIKIAHVMLNRLHDIINKLPTYHC